MTARTPAQIAVEFFPRWNATPELLRLVDSIFAGYSERDVIAVITRYRLYREGHELDMAVLRRLASEHETSRMLSRGPTIHTSLGPMPTRSAYAAESYAPRGDLSARVPESRRHLLSDPVSAAIYIRRHRDNPSPRVREFVAHLCTVHGIQPETDHDDE